MCFVILLVHCVRSKVFRNCNDNLGMLGYSENKSFSVLLVAIAVCVSDGRKLVDYLKINKDILRYIIQSIILLQAKFLQFDWLRAIVF